MYNVIDLLTNVLIDTDVESLEEARAYQKRRKAHAFRHGDIRRTLDIIRFSVV